MSGVAYPVTTLIEDGARVTGKQATTTLAAIGQVGEFVQMAYRHGKAILAFGESQDLLEANGAFERLPNGDKDEGIVHGEADQSDALISQFLRALASHRQDARDRDPPPV